ncbi:unnamed protein product [Prunus armeniaca]
MSRRSLRSLAAKSVRSRWHSQESTSRSRWEMEDVSSVCSRLCYCGKLSKCIHRGRFLILEGGFKYVQGGRGLMYYTSVMADMVVFHFIMVSIG